MKRNLVVTGIFLKQVNTDELLTLLTSLVKRSLVTESQSLRIEVTKKEQRNESETKPREITIRAKKEVGGKRKRRALQ